MSFAMAVYAVAQERACFEHYTTDQGLNSNDVYCLAQDENGFVWGCTSNGLFRFDGHYFKRFTLDNYPGMFRNDLRRIECLGNGIITVGGYNGTIVFYDKQRDVFEDKTAKDFFTSYFKEIRGFVRSGSSNDYYMFTSGGVYLYDVKTESFSTSFPAYNAMKDLQVYSMNMDSYGRFWLGTSNGLQIYDKNGTLVKSEFLSNSIKAFVSGIIRLNERQYLVSFVLSDLWLFTINEDGSVPSPQKIHKPFENITAILKDKRGRVWFATDGEGLWYSDSVAKGEFFQLSPYGEDAVYATKKIYSMLEDKSGDIWIGTRNSGLWKYSRDQFSGVVFSKNIGFPSAIVTSFHNDKEGNLLIGSDGTGLYRFSPNYKLLNHWTNANGLTSNNILSVTYNEKDGLYLGTWGGGVCHADPQLNNFSQSSFPEIQSPTNRCVNVLNMKNGDKWISTGGDGLYHQTKKGKWKRVALTNGENVDEWVSMATEGENNVVWVISSTNVWRIEKEKVQPMLLNTERQGKQNPISFNDITCDFEGNCLLATDRGLHWISADGGSFKPLDFLPSGIYATVLVDKNGMIWTCGETGILSVDLEKETYNRIWYDEQYCNRNYFTAHSSFQDKNGMIYFGAKDGFLMLYPHEKQSVSNLHYFAFNELNVAGKKVMPGTDMLHEGHLSQIEKLVLTPKQTNISISFDCVDFSQTNEFDCQYRLQGFNDEWILFDKNERVIRFSYIPSGKYDLQVRLVRKDNAKVVDTIHLKITVLTPWWATWWAKLFIVLAFCALSLIVALYRIRLVKRRNLELEQKVDERTNALKEANREILSQNNSLKESQLMLEIKNEELDNALKCKDHLISIIAHDLKNPMFGIVGVLDDLNKNSELFDEEKRKIVLLELSETARHLQMELVDLLAWATSQKQDFVSHPSSTDISRVIIDEMALFKGISKDKNIEMSFDDQLEAEAWVDQRMISVVIRNILANALKFTRRDGWIKISATQIDDNVIVSVEDNGIGMTENQKSQIFYKEFTTCGTENEKGTGLGLKMCKRLLDLISATIEVQSVVEKGTKMTITLPRSKDNAQSQNGHSAQVIPVPEEMDLLSENTILIVEDDFLIRTHLRGVLEPYMMIIEATNGAEAMEILQQNRPDLILSDVEMPVMDGIQLSKQLRASADFASIPLLFLSAKGSDEDRLKGLMSGAVDYLIKPFDDKELLIKLCNIMMIRRNQQRQLLQSRMEDESVESLTADEAELIDPLLKQVLDMVEEKYSDSEFSAENIYGDLNMSFSSLNRKMKMLTGKTASGIISEYRLHKAKKLLDSSGMNVSEVAYNVGFSDPHYFSRKYKAFFGNSPSEKKKAE